VPQHLLGKNRRYPVSNLGATGCVCVCVCRCVFVRARASVGVHACARTHREACMHAHTRTRFRIMLCGDERRGGWWLYCAQDGGPRKAHAPSACSPISPDVRQTHARARAPAVTCPVPGKTPALQLPVPPPRSTCPAVGCSSPQASRVHPCRRCASFTLAAPSAFTAAYPMPPAVVVQAWAQAAPDPARRSCSSAAPTVDFFPNYFLGG